MFIPLRQENMEGRRWPVISIALVLIKRVAFLATPGRTEGQNPKDEPCTPNLRCPRMSRNSRPRSSRRTPA